MQHSPYYRVVPGADTAVLFVHGIVGTPAHFRDLVPLVPKSWSVYNILLDGHGGEVEDFARTSMKRWKTQVHGTVEEILSTHEHLLLVGHSMGSLFCIEESLSHLDQILGLFLLNVPLFPRVKLTSVPHIIQAALGRAEPGSPAELLLLDCGVLLSPQLWKYLSWIPRYWELILECCRVRNLAGNISHPCICIQSTKDELVSRHSCNYLRKFSQLCVVELPNSGHFGYVKGDLETVQQQFLSFIRKK